MKGANKMLLEHNEITLENFTKQNITFIAWGIRAYLKDFVNDEVDGDYVVVDFYKKDEKGNFNLTEQQDIEIYTNKTADNLIRNIKGYIRAEFEIVRRENK